MDFTNSPPEWQNNGEEPSQSLKESGFTPGYKPPASFFNWFWSKVGKCLSEIQNKMLGQKRLTELPSATKEYTFDSNTEFTAVERCTLGLVTEGSDKFLRVTTAENSGNKYALAQLNFSDIGQTADTFAIELDTRMPASRWYISLVDLTKRPGESNKISYDLTGVAFSCGTTDGSNYNVCGTTVFGNAFVNTWLHMRLEVDVTAQTVKYDIRNRSTDTSLASGTVDFRDSGTDKITGIELYTYMQTSIDVDNIKITAGYEIEENVLYLVGDGDVYDSYVYFDGEPVCVAAQTQTVYSTTPQRIGTWIDGTPVWRVAFNRSYTTDERSDMCVSTQAILYSFCMDNNKAYIINIFAVSKFMEDPCVIDDLIMKIEGQTMVIPDSSHEGFYGYVDFVTPQNNLRQGEI